MKKNITQAEYNFLQDRLSKLDATDARLKQDLKHALNVGSETWHDNDMFDTAKNQKLHADIEREEINQILRQSEVIKKIHSNRVGIGTLVEIQDEDDNVLTLKIGGDVAPRLGNNWVSTNAPLPKLLLNKKAGDIVTGKISDENRKYKILSISIIEQ